MELEHRPGFSYPIKEEEIDLTQLPVPGSVTLKLSSIDYSPVQ